VPERLHEQVHVQTETGGAAGRPKPGDQVVVLSSPPDRRSHAPGKRLEEDAGVVVEAADLSEIEDDERQNAVRVQPVGCSPKSPRAVRAAGVTASFPARAISAFQEP
jgi:hypothetical protein